MKDRAYRMRMYFLAMTVRLGCVISLIWVRGPWIILVAAGAILLPYFAVLVGNAVSHVGGQAHESPAPLELAAVEEAPPAADPKIPPSQITIVIDAPADRRAQSDEDAT